ncbi:hypothetical protein JMM81_15805 [Bacillus sp. V3B]|uniref:hypothetical protein n=1 Tax=Bacillus sp. V3B TaxID=2804915 RepID=UPI002108965F|nr:hypothetical protein [Bacillus sp. V3B]MCQ6276380.1 hypothetical protein [Bacillus sp. V3B]
MHKQSAGCSLFISLAGFYLALKYRQPITGVYTIAGAVLVAGSLTHFSLIK